MAMALVRNLSFISTNSSFPTPSKSHEMNCYKRYIPTRASAEDSCPVSQDARSRRDLLRAFGVLATNVLSVDTVLAAQLPKGYKLSMDKFDGYSFAYPFGWQEVVVKGQDVTYKDVIEPLESASVTIVPTKKTDVHDYGSPEQVAETLILRVLTPPSQSSNIVNVKERSADGKNYYKFEFVVKAPNYMRHAIGTVAIGNGKFYTLTTGANERRWPKVQEQLHAIVDSFTIFDV